MPKVSVIVPVYKVEKYLQRCLDSLLNQTFVDFDLILIDDGSPDKCGGICEQYADSDKRVHVIHQKNGGLSAARNSGIEWSVANSGSQWITFVDSDDWVHPQYLNILYETAMKYKTDISVCAYREMTNDKSQIYDMVLGGDDNKWTPEDFFVQHHVNATVAWGKLYKKECFRILRYPVGKIHEDEFITYQLLFSQSFVAFTGNQLYYYYINNSGIMKSESMYKRRDALDAYLQQIDFFENNEYKRAKKVSARAYAGVLCSWICEINSLYSGSKEKERLQQDLLKKLKNALREYREEMSFDECRWAYSVAYPRRVRCYGFIERAVNKVKRIW